MRERGSGRGRGGGGRERERERERERDVAATHTPIMAPVSMFVMLAVLVMAFPFLCPGTLISNNLVSVIHLCKHRVALSNSNNRQILVTIDRYAQCEYTQD